MTLKENLIRYLSAGFPILYVNTFEEAKVLETIMNDDIAARRTVAVWSLANGYGEYSSKTHEWIIPISKDEASDIHTVLNAKLAFIGDLKSSIFVIKDAHNVLEDELVVAGLKEIAIKISEGLDCCIILISSVVKIPIELEKYITILESDYQSYDDICNIINNYVGETCLDPLSPKLLEDMAIVFKGLSEFEIRNLLSLAFAEDGKFTRDALNLIFDLPKCLILFFNISLYPL